MDCDTSQLTKRELEIALLAAQGLRTVDMARLLYISTRTVDAHLRRIYVKTKVSNRIQLLKWLTDNAAGQPAPVDTAAGTAQTA